MYSNNSSEAIGFVGLRSYVTDIDKVLRLCRDESGEVVLDQGLIRDLHIDSDPSEPLGTDHRDHAYLHGSTEQAVVFDSAKSKSSLVPALTITSIVVTGLLTVGLMKYLDQNVAPIASSSLLELVEEVPPLGRGLLLNPAQIRYCIAQGIRLGGATENTESLSAASEINLQAMLDDYENRCSEYRFQAGAYDTARREVESLRGVLQHEGFAMLASLEHSSQQHVAQPESVAPMVGAVREEPQLQVVMDEAPLLEDAPTREVTGVVDQQQVIDRTPRRFIKDVQWRLYKLKYYSGPIDGVDSTATQHALRGFFSVHTEAADATDEQTIFRAIDKIYVQRH